EIDSFAYLILDLKRVLQIDECAVALLGETAEVLRRHQKRLLLTDLPEHSAARFARDRQTENCASELWPDVDSALEWCEDRILENERPELLHEHFPVPLAGMNILAGFDAQELALIESIVTEKCYGPGATIIREGEVADSVYLLATGRVSVCLNIDTGARRQRL